MVLLSLGFPLAVAVVGVAVLGLVRVWTKERERERPPACTLAFFFVSLTLFSLVSLCQSTALAAALLLAAVTALALLVARTAIRRKLGPVQPVSEQEGYAREGSFARQVRSCPP